MMKTLNGQTQKLLHDKTDRYRRAIYSNFAEKAKVERLKWVVLHGAEDYPKKIGRDLDILCGDKNEIANAAILFKLVAEENIDTKWIIFPNPFWGTRVLAVSSKYEVAELHILDKLNSGVISCSVDFDSVDNSKIFPVDNNAFEFKAIVLPVLGSSKKVFNTVSDKRYNQLNPAVQAAYNNLLNTGKTSMVDKIKIYKSYVRSIPDMIENLHYSLNLKKRRNTSPTTPLVRINFVENALMGVYFQALSELFLDFICGDELTLRQIRYHQSRQLLIYFTKDRDDIDMDLNIDNLDVVNAIEQTVDAFCKYNEKFHI